MQKRLFISFLFFLFLQIIPNILFSQEEILEEGGDVEEEFYSESSDFLKGVSFSSIFNLEDTSLLFLHSDTLFRFGWCNDTIHIRRYDFTKKEDTTILVLNDNENMCCYSHPFCGNVTSQFGFRRSRYHYGVDVKLYTGDSVYNAFDGIVRISTYSRSYGHVVVVRHFNGLETLYAHLSQKFVEPNTPVRSGEVLGLGGNTGRSYGSHLHFEVRYFGEPINPNDIIDFGSFCLKQDTLFLEQKHFEYLVEARKVHYYTIRSGDTLSTIARRNGTSVRALCRLNNMKSTTILRIGRKIRLS
ncbi:MAG: M23 family metallopeptidase [Bacteroidales bacterium]|nr:M23 family metallopeptidase [Bacteroidales bacterium]